MCPSSHAHVPQPWSQVHSVPCGCHAPPSSQLSLFAAGLGGFEQPISVLLTVPLLHVHVLQPSSQVQCAPSSKVRPPLSQAPEQPAALARTSRARTAANMTGRKIGTAWHRMDIDRSSSRIRAARPPAGGFPHRLRKSMSFRAAASSCTLSVDGERQARSGSALGRGESRPSIRSRSRLRPNRTADAIRLCTEINQLHKEVRRTRVHHAGAPAPAYQPFHARERVQGSRPRARVPVSSRFSGGGVSCVY